ncbi:MAG: efflux RND transporter periplasmic adaptor subunit [Polyangiaceae bacterium]|nr:efflux RND transporter periplasmic adaptor subunit [Polyangiaceae bacterium]
MNSRTILILLALAFPLSLVACKSQEVAAADKGANGGKGGGRTGISFAVDILQVESQKLDYIVTAPGTVDAFERVQVTARVAGAVDRVAFREGQEVKAGDVLVVIDSQRYQLAVNSAKAALDKTIAAQKDTEAMVTRREEASNQNPGLIPGEELASYRTKSLTAKADTEVANENLKVATLNLRDSAVRAPMAGVIQTRTVETGQYVGAGYVMATLLQSDPMLLHFEVEPSDAPRIKPGMTASFTMRETQRAFTAKITLVSGAADTTTHMVSVTGQVDIDNHRYWLRPGSFCDVTIAVGATRDAPVIPRSATRATDHGYVVYVAKDDVVEERVVTLGMNSKDGWVEVRTGIQAGDWIVVRGAEALSTGARVRATRVTATDGGQPSLPDDNVDAGSAGRAGASSDGGKRDERDGGVKKGAAP